MKRSTDSTRKLWQTLGLLALAIVLVIVIDSLSFPQQTIADTLNSDNSNALSENDPSKLISETDDTSTTTNVADSTDTIVRLTLLGECAPGSPFGTDAYGSLNALAAEHGTDYFFSAIRSVLALDDMTVAANTCIFKDTEHTAASSLCAAPTANASVYADGSVETIINFANASTAEMDAIFSELDVSVIDGGTSKIVELNGIRIALFTTVIEKETDHATLLTYISEVCDTVDYSILYFYSGEENSHNVETWMKNALYTFADTGVDLLVGTGCDVLRPCEYYGNSVIAYSLGTVIDGAHLVQENATALIQLKLEATERGEVTATLEFVPCFVYQNHWQPAIMTDPDDRERVHRYLSGELQLPIEVTN